MEEQEDKQPPQRISLAYVEQVNSDFIMALAMQQQEHERAYTMLETIESDSDEDESFDSNSNTGLDTYDPLQSQEFHSRWDFLADDEETTDEDMDEDVDEDELDDFDLDELTYEELVALGEFIGEEKRGLPMNEIPSCLHSGKFRTIENKSGMDRCVICQVEYEDGEELAALPCEHPYHSECISKWLQIKRVCPMCGTEVSSPKAKAS